MSIGLLFWLIYIIAVIFTLILNRPLTNGPQGWYPLGGNLIVFVLLFLLGWAQFGFVIRG